MNKFFFIVHMYEYVRFYVHLTYTNTCMHEKYVCTFIKKRVYQICIKLDGTFTLYHYLYCAKKSCWRDEGRLWWKYDKIKVFLHQIMCSWRCNYFTIYSIHTMSQIVVWNINGHRNIQYKLWQYFLDYTKCAWIW